MKEGGKEEKEKGEEKEGRRQADRKEERNEKPEAKYLGVTFIFPLPSLP